MILWIFFARMHRTHMNKNQRSKIMNNFCVFWAPVKKHYRTNKDRKYRKSIIEKDITTPVQDIMISPAVTMILKRIYDIGKTIVNDLKKRRF